MNLGNTEKSLLKEIAGLEAIPAGAYNVRENGKLAGRNVTAHIDIVTKKDKPGIDIYIKSETKGERGLTTSFITTFTLPTART